MQKRESNDKGRLGKAFIESLISSFLMIHESESIKYRFMRSSNKKVILLLDILK